MAADADTAFRRCTARRAGKQSAVIAALIAGLTVWLTGWAPIDPLLSLIVCGLLLSSAARLFRDGGNELTAYVVEGPVGAETLRPVDAAEAD